MWYVPMKSPKPGCVLKSSTNHNSIIIIYHNDYFIFRGKQDLSSDLPVTVFLLLAVDGTRREYDTEIHL